MYNYSLIIPHHNMPERLERLLITIPNRKDLQIIVVDDCSDKYLNEYNNLKLKYSNVEWYSTGTNGGAGKARNIGLVHSKGEYIIFADSDDYFNICFNKILNKYKDNPFDLIFFYFSCQKENSFENSDRIDSLNRILHKYLHCPSEIKYHLTYPWGKIYKKSLIDKYNIRFEETIVSNDVRFSTIYDYHADSILIDPIAIYCYMVDDNSVSRKIDNHKLLVRVAEDSWRWNFIKKNNTSFKMGFVMEPIILKLIDIKDHNLIKKCRLICSKNGISYTKFNTFIIKTRIKKLLLKVYKNK